MHKSFSITAIIVTYNPSLTVLHKLINSLQVQVDSIVVVDNGSGKYLRKFFKKKSYIKLNLIYLDFNYGIAYALNKGINWAIQNYKSHVILFDHDSIPESNMIKNMKSALSILNRKNLKVAAIGPKFKDKRNPDINSFLRLDGIHKIIPMCNTRDSIVETDFIITSGCLIPIEVIKNIGGLLNELFIDQVDIEWCLRAKSYGYSIFGVCNAKLQHSLGESPVKIFGKTILHHSPSRYYYIIRNGVYLALRKYIPFRWKIYFLQAIIKRLIIYSMFIKPRTIYFKMILKGIYHGIIQKMGKYK